MAADRKGQKRRHRKNESFIGIGFAVRAACLRVALRE